MVKCSSSGKKEVPPPAQTELAKAVTAWSTKSRGRRQLGIISIKKFGNSKGTKDKELEKKRVEFASKESRYKSES